MPLKCTFTNKVSVRSMEWLLGPCFKTGVTGKTHSDEIIAQLLPTEVFKLSLSYKQPSTDIVEFLLTGFIAAFSLFPHGTVTLSESDMNYVSKAITSEFTLHFEVTLLTTTVAEAKIYLGSHQTLHIIRCRLDLNSNLLVKRTTTTHLRCLS